MADATLEFRVTDNDNNMLGRVLLEHVPPSLVNMQAYDKADLPIGASMRLQMDSIERQLPATLTLAGMTDAEAQEEAVGIAMAWAVEITGGKTQIYDLALGDRAVHVIQYSDGEQSLISLLADAEFGPLIDFSETVRAPGTSIFQSHASDAGGTYDADLYRRAAISRHSFPTHTVKWKALDWTPPPPPPAPSPAPVEPPADEESTTA